MCQSGSALDQSIADMNRSVIQLMATQKADSMQLQQQTQQNQVVPVADTDGLRSLAGSTQPRISDNIFVSIWTYDATNKEGFFQWVERLDTAWLQSGRDICTEPLSKVGSDVRTCGMGLTVNLLWSSV